MSANEPLVPKRSPVVYSVSHLRLFLWTAKKKTLVHLAAKMCQVIGKERRGRWKKRRAIADSWWIAAAFVVVPKRETNFLFLCFADLNVISKIWFISFNSNDLCDLFGFLKKKESHVTTANLVNGSDVVVTWGTFHQSFFTSAVVVDKLHNLIAH